MYKYDDDDDDDDEGRVSDARVELGMDKRGDYRDIDLDLVLRTSNNLDDGTHRPLLVDDELSFSDRWWVVCI